MLQEVLNGKKCYGGTGDEFGNAIVTRTLYGGYAIATFTSSNDGDVSGNHEILTEILTDGSYRLHPKGNCYISIVMAMEMMI